MMTPEELKKVREALGLTQAELAHHMGVAANTVARWEQGARAISTQVASHVRTLKGVKT